MKRNEFAAQNSIIEDKRRAKRRRKRGRRGKRSGRAKDNGEQRRGGGRGEWGKGVGLEDKEDDAR